MSLHKLCGGIGVAAGIMATFLGGWDAGLQALLTAMAVDFALGLMVAGVFKRSPKSPNGRLESRAGWKGLCRKIGSLFLVVIAVQLAAASGLTVIRDAVVIAFLANEVISITENLGLMGVPIPKAITNAIDILKSKEEQDHEQIHN